MPVGPLAHQRRDAGNNRAVPSGPGSGTREQGIAATVGRTRREGMSARRGPEEGADLHGLPAEAVIEPADSRCAQDAHDAKIGKKYPMVFAVTANVSFRYRARTPITNSTQHANDINQTPDARTGRVAHISHSACFTPRPGVARQMALGVRAYVRHARLRTISKRRKR